MHTKMTEQLHEEIKLDYNSPNGLIMLYAQSGGAMDE